MTEIAAQDRLIVALDVDTHDEAVKIVDELDNVSFFKIGIQLFLTGDLFGLLKRLRQRKRAGGGIFIDLKLGGDIGNTITKFVERSRRLGIRFITLVQTEPISITKHSIQAVRAARGGEGLPQVLMVPYLSSLGVDDLRAVGINESVDDYIVRRGMILRDFGCDGLIVSGTAVGTCRRAFGPQMLLVSPGIRPSWSAPDDHARLTTPGEAISMGADYLVVGRPVRNAKNRRDAAQQIIDEIDEALAERSHPAGQAPLPRSRSSNTTPPSRAWA